MVINTLRGRPFSIWVIIQVGEPGGAGVSETVSGEIGQAEVSNNLITTGRVADGGRRVPQSLADKGAGPTTSTLCQT